MTIRPLVALTALCLLGCTGKEPQSEQQKGPPQQSATPMTQLQTPEFDGTAAFGYLTRQTSFGPRNPNSVGHRLCLDYLAATLRASGASVRLQDFTAEGYAGETLRLTNVIGSFRPEALVRVLLCAHWDTRPRAENDPDRKKRNEPILGANDGASGVAVLLEIASLMKNLPPPIGVDIVLFDGEDYGKEGDTQNYLLGSRYFAKNREASYVPRFGVLLDMVGNVNLELPKEQNSVDLAPDVVSLVWNTARDLGITQFIDAPGPTMVDDHLPLNEAGIKAIDLIDFAYPDESNRYWHSHQDTPEHCSPVSLAAVGTVLTHVVYAQRP